MLTCHHAGLLVDRGPYPVHATYPGLANHGHGRYRGPSPARDQGLYRARGPSHVEVAIEASRTGRRARVILDEGYLSSTNCAEESDEGEVTAS